MSLEARFGEINNNNNQQVAELFLNQANAFQERLNNAKTQEKKTSTELRNKINKCNLKIKEENARFAELEKNNATAELKQERVAHYKILTELLNDKKNAEIDYDRLKEEEDKVLNEYKARLDLQHAKDRAYILEQIRQQQAEKEAEEEAEAAEEARAREAGRGGGKRKSKGNSKKKPVVSQKKQSIYKEILGKQMKIYKMPDSRKEYVKYKGELLHIADYKNLMKQKAIAKTKTKPKVTQQKAIAKTKTKK
jgi:hypothetical protein